MFDGRFGYGFFQSMRMVEKHKNAYVLLGIELLMEHYRDEQVDEATHNDTAIPEVLQPSLDPQAKFRQGQQRHERMLQHIYAQMGQLQQGMFALMLEHGL